MSISDIERSLSWIDTEILLYFVNIFNNFVIYNNFPEKLQTHGDDHNHFFVHCTNFVADC